MPDQSNNRPRARTSNRSGSPNARGRGEAPESGQRYRPYQESYPRGSASGHGHAYRDSAGGHSGRTPRNTPRRETSSTPYPSQVPGRRGAASRESANPHQTYRTGRPSRHQPQGIRGISPKALGIFALILIACGIGIFFYLQSLPITVLINGAEHQLGGDKSIQTILDEKLASPAPGDLVAVDGAVIEAGAGETLHASVNGQQTTDIAAKLANGDTVEISNGANKAEPSDDTQETVPYSVITEGIGTIHIIEGIGADGIRTTKVGQISGKTFVEDTTPVQNQTCFRYYPDTGEDKVIALTLDDGPLGGSTDRMLDFFDEMEVKATFFTIGEQITGDNVPTVKRAFDAGHQISTHSFDHARGSGNGVDLSLMTPEEQIAEIEKGYEAIKAATGAKPTRTIRTPGGNFPESTQKILAPYISAEIGWDIDTQDWAQPGAGAIADAIKSASSGSIVLCHDGGGTRAQTLEALKIAIPHLKEQGYRFITVDEMLAYPPYEGS